MSAENQTKLASGFRLNWMEIRNWGTFDKYVWRMTPEGETSLMTGDNGCGKSTIVDAIVTLLIPHPMITFNKSSGAKKQDRTIYSYLRGAYKNVQDENNKAKAIFLRDDNSYSVLLACFQNKVLNQTITLAQVFWLENHKLVPKKLFIVAHHPLTVENDFTGFGSDIRNLKKKLKEQKGVEVFDSFAQYGNYFRKRVGIDNIQALDLFLQMVSMKKVGVLTNFIRERMIERGHVEPRVNQLCENFENLSQSHDAVLQAEAQLKILEPLVEEATHYRSLGEKKQELERTQASLDQYFARYEIQTLNQQIVTLNFEIENMENSLKTHSQEERRLEHDRLDLKKNMEDSGGARIVVLTQQISNLRELVEKRKQEYAIYQSHAEEVDLPLPDSNEVFQGNRRELVDILNDYEVELKGIEERRLELALSAKTLMNTHKELQTEVDSIKQGKTQIPMILQKFREQLAEALQCAEDEIPYAAELLQVCPEAQEWEGAIERLLHGFGTTLLVPNGLYHEVRDYVNSNRIQVNINGSIRGLRIVYQCAEENMSDQGQEHSHPSELITKIEIKSDHPFRGWLEKQIRERFDYVCCASPRDFDSHRKALTREGQIKTYQRHEKDDRQGLSDRSQFILGWSPQHKVASMEEDLRKVEKEGQLIAAKIADTNTLKNYCEKQKDHAKALQAFKQFENLDFYSLEEQLQQAVAEKKNIESSSDLLRTFQERSKQLDDSIFIQRQLRENLIREHAVVSNRRKHYLDRVQHLEQAILNALEAEKREFVKLDEILKEQFGEAGNSLDNIPAKKLFLQDWIMGQLSETNREINRLGHSMIKRMSQFAAQYPAEVQDFEASLEAMAYWEKLYYQLKREDLPRHKNRFKELLNEGAINGLALFKHQLEREEEDIRKKIEKINESLCQIDYDLGTYIALIIHPILDPEIREFRAELKGCLDQEEGDEDLYNEEKFLKVKALIERFKGREGQSEEDRRWRDKVIDVRNWMSFNASERWRETDEEKEFYSGTSTKSTGQQEKLAYTVLASAIAYQFGLDWIDGNARGFRFIVIDEAFSVGSDKNTRYALELFKKLGLQVLIVTPLQKLHVIEPYIQNVHFIYNENGAFSQIENLPIKTYQDQKKNYRQQPEEVQLVEDDEPLLTEDDPLEEVESA
ncbi:SbcC/MukB-like Walker B domain-containing protein [Deltaproteobacteria bacterium TL4]